MSYPSPLYYDKDSRRPSSSSTDSSSPFSAHSYLGNASHLYDLSYPLTPGQDSPSDPVYIAPSSMGEYHKGTEKGALLSTGTTLSLLTRPLNQPLRVPSPPKTHFTYSQPSSSRTTLEMFSQPCCSDPSDSHMSGWQADSACARRDEETLQDYNLYGEDMDCSYYDACDATGDAMMVTSPHLAPEQLSNEWWDGYYYGQLEARLQQQQTQIDWDEVGLRDFERIISQQSYEPSTSLSLAMPYGTDPKAVPLSSSACAPSASPLSPLDLLSPMTDTSSPYLTPPPSAEPKPILQPRPSRIIPVISLTKLAERCEDLGSTTETAETSERRTHSSAPQPVPSSTLSPASLQEQRRQIYPCHLACHLTPCESCSTIVPSLYNIS